MIDYRGNSVVQEIGTDPVYVSIYNDTGSALTAYVPVLALPKWITGVGYVLVPLTPGTNTAVKNVVVIPQEATADASYGQAIKKGLTRVVTSGTVAANDYLEVINAGVALIDQGTNGGAITPTEACAVAVENITTNVWYAYMIGQPCTIAAS